MKKNLLFSALLAMLALCVFVSCSDYEQDKTAELVRASFYIGGVEKSLVVAGNDASDIASYKYCMQPKFTSSNITNPTVGVKADGSYDNTAWTDVVITAIGEHAGSGTLGYCTQGIWDFKLRGYNSQGIAIYEGELKNFYINANTTGIQIDLKRIFEKPDTGSSESDKGTLKIEANTVRVSSDTEMRVSYQKVTGSSSNVFGTEKQMEKDNTYSAEGRIGYSFEDATLDPGRYLVKVSYYNTTPTEILVGSQVFSIVAIAGSVVDVSGSLDTNMFKQEGLTITTEGAITVAITTSGTDFKCNLLSGPVDGTYVYEWFVNGVKDSSNVSFTTKASELNYLKFPATYSDPGYYDIACVVYWVKGDDKAIVSASTTAIINN